MKRRLLALFLTVCCAASLFSACGKETASETDSVADSDPVTSEVSTDTGKKTETDKNANASLPDDPDAPECDHYCAVTDALTDQLIVYDLDVEDWNSAEAIVWKMNMSSLGGEGADVKFRHSEYWGGDVVVTFNKSFIYVIEYETKKVLWKHSQVLANPHSCELLPNGCVAIASTSDNTVCIYSPTTSSFFTISHPDAHSVLWDPDEQALWIGGMSNIRAYSFTGTVDEPKAALRSDRNYIATDMVIHDLAPVYGDTSKLWVAGDGVVILDKETGKLDSSFSGSVALKQNGMKGIGSFPDGRIVCTYATGYIESWSTDKVTYISAPSPTRVRLVTRSNKGEQYYKVRVWIADYQ